VRVGELKIRKRDCQNAEEKSSRGKKKTKIGSLGVNTRHCRYKYPKDSSISHLMPYYYRYITVRLRFEKNLIFSFADNIFNTLLLSKVKRICHLYQTIYQYIDGSGEM
jgi:hypothetical protein